MAQFNPETPDEVLDEFLKDVAPQAHLGRTADGLATLHAKYEKIRSKHVLKAKKLEDDLKILKKNKWLWVSGKLSKEQHDQLKWPPFEMRLLKKDYDTFINSDPDVIMLGQVVAFHQEMVTICENIRWELGNRNKSIQKAIDYERFLAGN